MEELDKIEEDLCEIKDELINQIYVAEHVESVYLKELLLDNINKSYFIIQCINSILIYSYYFKSDIRRELIVGVIRDIKKQLNVSDEDILELLNNKDFENDFQIANSYLTKTEDSLAEFNLTLVKLGIFVLTRDYSALQDNMKIILGGVFDFIPVVSEYKQICEMIKDLATCVNNLEKHQKYHEEIKIIDAGINNIEVKNRMLTKVFEFLYSINFVREYFNKNIKDFK